jgi:hypothetical protein
MQAHDLERIAKAALRELGAGNPPLTVVADEKNPDRWRINVAGNDPVSLSIRAGSGTTAQFVREQIVNQLTGR